MFKTIGTFIVDEWEQEEIEETKQVAGEDGVVETITTFIQPYAHIKAEVIVKQEQLVDKNWSYFRAELWLTATAGEKGDGFSVGLNSSPFPADGYTSLRLGNNAFPRHNFFTHFDSSTSAIYQDMRKSFNVPAGQTISRMVALFDSSINVYRESRGDYNYSDITKSFYTYHNIDGKYTSPREGSVYINGNRTQFLISGLIDYEIQNLKTDGAVVPEDRHRVGFADLASTPEDIDRAVYPITADNFTDETDASFTYKATTSYSCLEELGNHFYNRADEITRLQVALSFDGINADIAWRDLDINDTRYTFNFTEEERELLRQKAQGSNPVPIYYLTKVNRYVDDTLSNFVYSDSAEIIGATRRQFTVLGCNPILNPTVEDIKEETLALTGNKYRFIRYESMAEFSTGATASKYATIIGQSVQCGSQVVYNLYNGIIQDVESATFIFTATDSRNLQIQTALQAELIEYLKPTCKQNVEIEISGEATAAATIKVSGNWYNGSFGVVDNELTLQIRHGISGEEFEEWQTISPTFNGNTYEAIITLDGYNYENTHVFQSRAIDKLNNVESVQYSTKLLPVFDWSKDDFNFNVPIQLNGQTVLRHNKEAKNTVLSASGGHIYIRPLGTDDTESETIFYPDGKVKFSGAVEYSEFSINGNMLNDYVIETGEAEMGSNGTWYWAKWASGKAECWGCRNFGTMAITTAWGSLYRSEILTQALPSGVFKTTPDVININIVSASNGGWICKHENTAPSAVSTGSFIYVRPASATPAATYIGFHVIGLWK